MQYRDVLLSWALVSVGAGCTSARDRYDEFDELLVDASNVQIDAPIVSTIPDVTGQFLVVARADLPTDSFFSFIGTLSYTPETANTGSLTMSMQPLDFETFAPVGEALDGAPVAVGADAGFDWPIVGTIPARANSITGSNAPINGVVRGTVITTDFACGDLTGQAGALPLAGTTFGAVRITGETLPAPIFRCEDAPPAP